MRFFLSQARKPIRLPSDARKRRAATKWRATGVSSPRQWLAGRESGHLCSTPCSDEHESDATFATKAGRAFRLRNQRIGRVDSRVNLRVTGSQSGHNAFKNRRSFRDETGRRVRRDPPHLRTEIPISYNLVAKTRNSAIFAEWPGRGRGARTGWRRGGQGQGSDAA